MSAKLIAFLLSASSLLAALFYGLVTVGYGCHGSDASSPPPEGSTGDALCTYPAAALHLVLGLAAVFAPIIAGSASRIGLATAFAISSGAIAALALVGSQIQHWNDFLFTYPPVALFLVALFYRTRQPAS